MQPTDLSRSPRNTNAAEARENTIAAINYAVAYFFGLSVEGLHHNNTTRAVTVPRQIAMYLIKQMTAAPLQEIGRRFGGKHPSTVMRAIATIEARRQIDGGMDLAISALVGDINGQGDLPRYSVPLANCSLRKNPLGLTHAVLPQNKTN